VSTPINIAAIQNSLAKNSAILTNSEKIRAKKAILSLKKGAPSLQISQLPECFCKNALSTFIHGAVVTETICSWVEKDFVASPFDTPPLKNFRVNRLVAIEQPSKIRPVLNLSAPMGGLIQ
jgi:hypothetical protein